MLMRGEVITTFPLCQRLRFLLGSAFFSPRRGSVAALGSETGTQLLRIMWWEVPAPVLSLDPLHSQELLICGADRGEEQRESVSADFYLGCWRSGFSSCSSSNSLGIVSGGMNVGQKLSDRSSSRNEGEKCQVSTSDEV